MKKILVASTVLVLVLVGTLIGLHAQQVKFEPYTIGPTVDAAYDIGTATNRFRDVFNAGHLVNLGGTAPTCSAACGSTATVLGNDTAMVWSLTGAGQASPIVITFSRLFGQIPACQATNQTTAANTISKILTTTSTATITFAAGPTASDKVSVICLGAGG
jgi:hypothetical protein